jgi:hypothetical protein
MSQYQDGEIISTITAIDDVITIDGVTNSVENFVRTGVLRQVGSSYAFSSSAALTKINQLRN